MTSKSKRDTGSKKKDEFYFTQIHYLREVRVPKTAPTEKVPEEEKLLELDINELPPLHRVAAKGSISDIEKLLDEGVGVNLPLPFHAKIPWKGDHTTVFASTNSRFLWQAQSNRSHVN